MAEIKITETANRITDAVKKASKNANDIVDAVMTAEVRAKFDALDKVMKEVEETKIDDLSAEKTEEVKEPTLAERVAEKQKLAVRAMAASNGSNVPEWAKEDNEIPSDYQVLSGKYGEILAKYKSAEQDIDVLRAELKEKIRELIDVKKKAEAEATDLKKTISKMQQTHEAEINDLKDQLQEAKAAQAAAEKSKAEINRERIELIDASENDDERFDEILKLARALCRGAGQLEELAMIVEDKVEGR